MTLNASFMKRIFLNRGVSQQPQSSANTLWTNFLCKSLSEGAQHCDPHTSCFLFFQPAKYFANLYNSSTNVIKKSTKMCDLAIH